MNHVNSLYRSLCEKRVYKFTRLLTLSLQWLTAIFQSRYIILSLTIKLQRAFLCAFTKKKVNTKLIIGRFYKTQWNCIIKKLCLSVFKCFIYIKKFTSEITLTNCIKKKQKVCPLRNWITISISELYEHNIIQLLITNVDSHAI